MVDEVIIKLKKLIKKLEQHQDYLSKFEITPSQVRIIFPIIKTGQGHTMQELVDNVGVDKSLVSRTIADLESKGYVERDKKENERNYKIVFSEKGKQFFSERKKEAKAHVDKWGDGITEQDLELFMNVLNKLTKDRREEKC